MQEIPADTTFSMKVTITPEMTAHFFDTSIHPVYATFAIVEHVEYASRCLIRRFLDPDEDAVGTAVSIEHHTAAPVGAVVIVGARLAKQKGSDITCDVVANWNDEKVATGTTVQRVVPKEKLRKKFESLS